MEKDPTAPAQPRPNEQLWLELAPLVCTNWGVTARMLRALIAQHSEAAIQQAVRVTENAHTHGKVKDIAGFFVQAVRQGYADTEGGKKEKVQQQKVQLEAQKQDEKAQKERIAHQKQQDFEKEKTAVLAQLSADKSLRSAVITRLHGGILRGSYDDTQSFEENMKTPLLLGAVLNIVKNITGS